MRSATSRRRPCPTAIRSRRAYDTLNRLITTYRRHRRSDHLCVRSGGQSSDSRRMATAIYVINRVRCAGSHRVSMTDALGKTSVYQYDPVGNVIKTTDRNGNFLNLRLDPYHESQNQRHGRILGDTTQMQYDPVGNRHQSRPMPTPARDAVQLRRRSIWRRRRRGLRRTARRACYTYDAVGNLATRKDRGIGLDHDVQLQRSVLPDPPEPIAGADQRCVHLRPQSGRMSRCAHAEAWPVDVHLRWREPHHANGTQNGKIIGYSYNIPGRTRTITYPGGRVITEQYDLRTRLGKVDDSLLAAADCAVRL